ARSEHEIESVAKEAAMQGYEGMVHAMVANAASEEDSLLVVDRTIRKFGAVHILVNNAGRGMRFVSEQFLDTPTKFWQADPSVRRMIIDTNVNGPFMMARVVVPHMLKQHLGRIVNL